ncbi:beta-1,3-galactosyltransferase 1-like [Lingula anatina]|uniref:Hexosyltransferase n=1 Tax=Lingula anatina TaxID=7574 RepID=A0A1S3IBL6_LINAN|nr:beta-1,3-galactosyltransferase 1-like [Lingula anatina]|eukprot:XP_013395647.1 beta-1,3-galactosyltransferase 1-like [Lingula anatina]
MARRFRTFLLRRVLPKISAVRLSLLLLCAWVFFALSVARREIREAYSVDLVRTKGRSLVAQSALVIAPDTNSSSSNSCMLPEHVCASKEATEPRRWYHLKKYDYVINRPLCDPKAPPYLLALVVSEPWDYYGRSMYRRTCGSIKTHAFQETKTVFFVGEQPGTENDIANEALRFGDVVKVGFVDSKGNLTLKTLLAFRWAFEYCPGARFVLKCGHDVIANYPEIVQYLSNLSVVGNSTHLFSGLLRQEPTRNAWLEPDWDPNAPNFAPHIASFASLLSLDTVRLLHSASLSKRLHTEAPFMSSIATEKGIRLDNNTKFWEATKLGFVDLARDRCRLLTALVIHRVPDPIVWNLVKRGYVDKKNACTGGGQVFQAPQPVVKYVGNPESDREIILEKAEDWVY